MGAAIPPRIEIRGFLAEEIMSDIGSWTGVGVKPQVSAVVWISSYLRVTFSEAMTKNATFLATSSYVLTPGGGSVAVSVSSVVSGPGANPIYIDLLLNKSLTIGVNNYTMTVSGSIIDKAGNTMNAGYVATVFSGNAARATITATPFATNLTRLRIQYSVPVKQVSASNADDALKPGNYSITGGVTVSSVATLNTSLVELTVANQVINTSYTVTVSNVQDLSNNAVA